MPTQLRLLIVEDHSADIDLMVYELQKAGYEVLYDCAETEQGFLESLREPVDLILADYTLPHFNGLRALEILQEKGLDIPFILISGTIDEDVAVQAIKKGAADYVLKDRLARLGPAVEQAITARSLRLENRRVEQALQESEAKFRSLVQQALEGIILINDSGEIVVWNKGVEAITGILRDQALGKPIWEVQFQTTSLELKTREKYSDLRNRYLQAIQLREADWFRKAEVQEIVRTDGSVHVIEGLTFPVVSDRAFWLCSVIRDMTDRVRAEQESNRQAERAEALVRVTRQLNAQLNLDAVLNTVCRETANALQVPLTMVMLYDATKDQLVQGAIHSERKDKFIHTHPIPLPVFESYASIDQPITVLEDLQLHNEWELARLYKQLEARTAVYLKMSHAGHFVGILGVYACGEVRCFTGDELTLLTGFANQAAVAIHNAWLFEQVNRGRNNLQALSQRLVEVQEDERRSIARELHDEIGQALTGLKMLFDTLPEIPAPVAERLNMGRSLVVDLIERTRRISLDLRPSMLDDLGLLPALLWHIERCHDQSLLEIDFKHAGLERRFSPAVETAAYRIIQEGCTNIIRHSGVTQARVHVWVDSDTLHIKVEDYGIGFDSRSATLNGAGGGLSGMRERAVLVGGSLEIHSEPSKGTTLIAQLPLQKHLERRMDVRSKGEMI